MKIVGLRRGEYEILLSRDIWSEKKLPLEYLAKAIELIKAMFSHG